MASHQRYYALQPQGRGRGGPTSTYLGHQGWRQSAVSKPVFPPTSSAQKLLQVISNKAFASKSTYDSLAIENCEYVASYNWLEKGAAVLIPGSPPAWQPPVNIPVLQQDSGDYFRDANGARYPKYPTEPAVKALFTLKPHFDGSTVDIFGCGSTIGSLLSFANSLERTFRFGVERVGKTLFLVRREQSPKELINGVYGYGHTFPEAYTSWDAGVKGSTSHQRLISYEIGGLRLVVRSESDGYLPKKAVGAQKIVKASPKEVKNVEISSLTMPILSTTDVASNKGLCLASGGQMIPQAAIFDLKTRSAGKEFNMDDILPRLWVNQTPNFIIGYHKRGKFDEIRIKDVKKEIKFWEQQNQDVLRRFRSVLHRLMEISDSEENAKMEVRRTGTGNLEIWTEVDTWEALPGKLKKQWKGSAIAVQKVKNGI